MDERASPVTKEPGKRHSRACPVLGIIPRQLTSSPHPKNPLLFTLRNKETRNSARTFAQNFEEAVRTRTEGRSPLFED